MYIYSLGLLLSLVWVFLSPVFLNPVIEERRAPRFGEDGGGLVTTFVEGGGGGIFLFIKARNDLGGSEGGWR